MAQKKVKSEEIVEDTEKPKSNQDWKHFLKMWEDKNIGLNEVKQAMDPLNGVAIRSKILKHNDAQNIIQSASQYKLVSDLIKEMTGMGKEHYAKQTLTGKAGEKMKVGPQPKLGIDLRKDVIGMGMSKVEANQFYTLVKNVDLTQTNVKQAPNEEKISPSDALVKHVKKEGFELKNFIGDSLGLIIIGYLLVLLFYSLLFSPLVSFILWIFTGFIIYKSLEAYGNDKTWFAQILDDFGNYGFTSQPKDLKTKIEENDVEIEPEEPEIELEEHKTKEEDLTLKNYTEKFDEWRIAKNAVQGPFISAGDKISGFNFNSKSLYKLRLWILILVIPLIWSLTFAGGGILSIIFTVWYILLNFPINDAEVLGDIGALVLSYFLIIRIYSHFTNKRNIPFNSDMMSDYDPYVVSHLFQYPKDKSTISITSKALLLDFIGGWFIIIFLMLIPSGYIINDILNTKSTDVSNIFSLALALILFAVTVPIIEELLFRGLILDSLSESYGKWTAIIISSVIFAILHIYPLTILNAFWAGIIYGYLRIRTNSLWPSIILHGLWNGHLEILDFFYFGV